VIEAECTRLELDVRQLTAALGDLRTALAEAEEDKAGAEKRRVCTHAQLNYSYIFIYFSKRLCLAP
jgi:hypothetical protein